MSDTEMFVVRIWQPPEGGFRAAVRRVDDEQSHLFTQADALTQFLRVAAQPGAQKKPPNDPV